MLMTEKIKERDLVALEAMFIKAQGRGFEPPSMRAAAIRRALAAGLVSKADADFFFEKRRGTHVVFTAAGKACLVRRIADRHGMDEEDALHLVRTGSYHLAESAVQSRREPTDETAVQSALLG
jgi:hypothetical protein